jgi:pimeloyl-ACP methyl ester carboxylesterase
MNCSPDLWAGCGLDDAITPVLDASSVDRQADVLLERLPKRFVLAGLSLGGIVAMSVAIRAPERIAGLVLIATNAKAPTDTQRRGWTEWLERLDAGVTARDLQRGILASLLTERSRATRPDLIERTLDMADATGAATLRSQLVMQGTRIDLRPALAGMTVPTLVVSGVEDPICPPRFHIELVEAIPRAQLVSLDGGHLLPMEKSAEFGGLVRSWAAPRALA